MDFEKIKQGIVDFITTKGMYDGIDEMLIDELIFNYKLMSQAKDEMWNIDKDRFDLLSDITRDPDKEAFFQKNRLLDIYNTAFKNVRDVYVKLGLTIQERHKMKIELTKAEDAFGKIFDS